MENDINTPSYYNRSPETNEENSFLVFMEKDGIKYKYHCKLCNLSKTYSRKYGVSELPLSCGCSVTILPKKDYTGETINGIFIIGYIGKSIWKVENSCGCIENINLNRVRAKVNSICVRCRPNKNELHGHAKRGIGGHTREYNSWCNLRRRCTDQTNNRYEYYGDLGGIFLF